MAPAPTNELGDLGNEIAQGWKRLARHLYVLETMLYKIDDTDQQLGEKENQMLKIN